SAERRVSAKTVDAYARDVRQFLVFLCGHFGSRPTLPALSRLKPLDVRAFMAARRADGVSSRSLMRMLAGVRSFARFLERSGKGNKPRMVPVLAQVTRLAAEYVALCPYDLPAEGPLFIGARGGPLSPRLVQLAMARLRGALGLPDSATPHALRHSFATHLLAR